MSTKPGVTRRPPASITRRASRADAPRSPTSTIRPPSTATSARRAGAPEPSTTVPPRISRSMSASPVEAVQRERVRAVEAETRVVGKRRVVLAQLVDDARVLRVAVRKVGRPDEPVGAAQRTQRADGALAGIEADPALSAEVLGRLHRQRRRGPPVALEELIQPVHPVADPAAAALEDRDLEAGVTFEHAAVDEVRQ